MSSNPSAAQQPADVAGEQQKNLNSNQLRLLAEEVYRLLKKDRGLEKERGNRTGGRHEPG
jgi:hypothetical protein